MNEHETLVGVLMDHVCESRVESGHIKECEPWVAASGEDEQFWNPKDDRQLAEDIEMIGCYAGGGVVACVSCVGKEYGVTDDDVCVHQEVALLTEYIGWMKNEYDEIREGAYIGVGSGCVEWCDLEDVAKVAALRYVRWMIEVNWNG